GRDEGAAAGCFMLAELAQQRRPQRQLAVAGTMGDDFDQATPRPAATGQGRIERGKTSWPAGRRRRAASAPEGWMPQQHLELLMMGCVAHDFISSVGG